MRSLPRRRAASARSAAATGERQAARLGSSGNHYIARDGPGHARRLNMRSGPDRRQRTGICLATMGSLFMSEGSTEIDGVLDAPQPTLPLPRGPVPQAPPKPEPRSIEIKIDGKPVSVAEGSTILDAAKKLGIDTPTLCYLESLTPVNVCRVCVVELEGSRTLVPACSRKVEPDMSVRTDSERVRLSRRLVLEFLASAVDVSTAPALQAYMQRYEARPERFGAASATVA